MGKPAMSHGGGSHHLTKCRRVLQWIRTAITFLVSHIGLCGLVVGYSLLGGWAFKELEAPAEEELKRTMTGVRKKVVDDILMETIAFEVLIRKNWTDKIGPILKNYEKELVTAVRKSGFDGADLQWTFPSAILYSIIVITTIGYGNIAPKTNWGKIVTIVYAIVGIPLMLLCMSNIGDAMAHSFKFIYWKLCCYLCAKPKRPQRTRSMRGNRRYPSTRSRPGSSRRYPHSLPDTNPPSDSMSRTSSYRSGRSEEDYDFQQDDARRGPASPVRSGGYSPPLPEKEANKVPIILNKYALESKEDLRVDLLSPGIERKDSGKLSRGGSKRGMRDDFDDYMGLEDVEEVSDEEEDTESPDRPVPIWLCVALVSSYLCGGAALFQLWESWDFFDSLYFCFITLTTIGFGDLVPGKTVSQDSQVTLSLCAVYLLFGMALLAMSFNLVQEQVTSAVTSIGKRLGIIGDGDEEEE